MCRAHISGVIRRANEIQFRIHGWSGGRRCVSALKCTTGDGGSAMSVNERRTILRSDARRARGYDFRLAARTEYCLVRDAAAVSRAALQGDTVRSAVPIVAMM